MVDEYPDSGLLIHLCLEREWQDAQAAGEVRPSSLSDQGFIHLSGQWQVHLPANRIFGGRDDLMALYVDPAAAGAPLLWEPGVPGDPESMLFPHLYGVLPVAAVVSARAYRPGPDGRFTPPEAGSTS